jgi:predicted RNase H-like nuclease
MVARRAVEVYPRPAIVSLFHLPSVITYKDKPGRDLEHLRAELGRLLGLLESLATATVPLFVAHSPAWQVIRSAVARASTKSQLRAVEDSVDALVCAYIARYSRHRPEGVRVFGDLATGYILTPVTADIAAAIDVETGQLRDPTRGRQDPADDGIGGTAGGPGDPTQRAVS